MVISGKIETTVICDMCHNSYEDTEENFGVEWWPVRRRNSSKDVFYDNKLSGIALLLCPTCMALIIKEAENINREAL
jgi:hypothetical protein